MLTIEALGQKLIFQNDTVCFLQMFVFVYVNSLKLRSSSFVFIFLAPVFETSFSIISELVTE